MARVERERADFLAAYTAECVAAGVEPLPPDALIVLVRAILVGEVAGAATVH